MKICFISLKAYPLFNPQVKAPHGGAEVQMYILARLLSENKDFDVNLITADYKQKATEKQDKLTVWRSFSFALFTPLKIFKLLFLFHKINADIYIQRTLSFYSFFIAAYFRCIGKKFIYMVAHDCELNGKDRLFKKLFGTFVIKMLYKYASAVIVQNQYQYDMFKKKFKNNNIFILKKIVETHCYTAIPQKEKLYDGIWIARAESWKQPEKYLTLASMNPDKKFMMICPYLSMSYSKNKYKKLIADIKMYKNIHFSAHIPHGEVFKHLQNSRIYCSTSSSEGDLPMSHLEAAGCGLPLLLLSIDEYHSTEEAPAGIFCGHDTDTMHKKFNALLSDDVLYNEYSNIAMNYVKKHHDSKMIIPRFTEFLLMIIK